MHAGVTKTGDKKTTANNKNVSTRKMSEAFWSV